MTFLTDSHVSTSLVSRNVTIGGHRTSMRLEPEMWRALFEIAKAERQDVNEICTRINEVRQQSSLTSAVRVVIVAYYRALADGKAPRGRVLDYLLGQ